MSSSMPDLTAKDLLVRFGGHIAVNHVSFHAPPGQITGLIGPNGAGKTTTFNACTGLVKTVGGSVHLGDQRLDHHAPSSRASRGLGRTFQRMELFDSMTVYDNVALGPECLYSSRHPFGQLISPRRERQDIASRARTAMERCGITDLARQISGDLSTGQRRLVELARAIASPFRFLLLDEPSSGLDHHETEGFGRILVDFVNETGIGILLVEHDMALVSSVCSYIYVLDFGSLIFSGTTSDTLSSDVVRAAYLGGEAVNADDSQVAALLEADEGEHIEGLEVSADA
jgi:ABC-type branched-subunit amino acid transport system ATPase component